MRGADRAVVRAAGTNQSPCASRQATRWRSVHGARRPAAVEALHRAAADPAAGRAPSSTPAPPGAGRRGRGSRSPRGPRRSAPSAPRWCGDRIGALVHGARELGRVLVVADHPRVVLLACEVGPAARVVEERPVVRAGLAQVLVVGVGAPARALAAGTHHHHLLARRADLLARELKRERVAAARRGSSCGRQAGRSSRRSRPRPASWPSSALEMGLEVERDHLVAWRSGQPLIWRSTTTSGFSVVQPAWAWSAPRAWQTIGPAAAHARVRRAVGQVGVDLQAADALIELLEDRDRLGSGRGSKGSCPSRRRCCRSCGCRPTGRCELHVARQLVLEREGLRVIRRPARGGREQEQRRQRSQSSAHLNGKCKNADAERHAAVQRTPASPEVAAQQPGAGRSTAAARRRP